MRLFLAGAEEEEEEEEEEEDEDDDEAGCSTDTFVERKSA